jgi:RNA methyltransferase, TrmH family
MISKNTLKYIHSLQQKKYRKQHQAFLVEGGKSVVELINSRMQILMVYATPHFVQKNDNYFKNPLFPYEVVEEAELAKAGTFQTNDAALAIAAMPVNELLYVNDREYVLMLDDIRDPGNLGTIIRIADWYGIHKIICSDETADVYNPKVIAATMGSFTRVRTYYCNVEEYLQQYPHLPVYGAFLNGASVHQTSFAASGIIVMGNESKGISPALEKIIAHKITIPAYGVAESLNAAVATAIICDNMRRTQA